MTNKQACDGGTRAEAKKCEKGQTVHEAGGETKPELWNLKQMVLVTLYQEPQKLKGLGHAILGNFSTDRMVIELTKISK